MRPVGHSESEEVEKKYDTVLYAVRYRVYSTSYTLYIIYNIHSIREVGGAEGHP